MNTSIHIRPLLTALICFLFMACGTDDTITTPGEPGSPPPPRVNVFSTINGLVLAESGGALTDAVVTLDGKETTSDENGFFSSTAFFSSEGISLKVSYPGYHDALAVILPLEDQAFTLNVTLQEETTETGNATSDNTIDLGKAAVDFICLLYTSPSPRDRG